MVSTILGFGDRKERNRRCAKGDAMYAFEEAGKYTELRSGCFCLP